MLKFSENLLIKSLDADHLVVIQSKDGADYRVTLDVKNDGKIKLCLQSDLFIKIEAEELVSVSQQALMAYLITKVGEYRLPILKERGIFQVEAEVPLSTDQPTKTWEYDFSKKSLVAKTDSGSLSAKVVSLGENFIARSVLNVLELYGDSSTELFGVSPQQFLVISKLGKTTVNYWEGGSVQFIGEKGEVRIHKPYAKMGMAAMEEKLSGGSFICKVDLSNAKLKTLTKFSMDQIFIQLKTGRVAFITSSARKTVEIPGLSLGRVITLLITQRDLSLLTGEVSIYQISFNNKSAYLLKVEDGDKISYALVKEAVDPELWGTV